jgi:hypothetical protein
MAWAIFTREFNWHRPKSKISFNAKADGSPKCRPHDFIEAAIRAGVAYTVASPNRDLARVLKAKEQGHGESYDRKLS